MREKFTSTWLIVAFLIGAMFLFSFLPSYSASEAHEMPAHSVGYEMDAINRNISQANSAVVGIQSN